MIISKLSVTIQLIIFGIVYFHNTNIYADDKNDQLVHIEFIGQALLPTGYRFKDTEVGGLSGITYDPVEDVYYAVSDDRGRRQPARFYRLEIDLSTGQLTNESIKVIEVTYFRNEHNEFYKQGTVDLEGIALTQDGSLFVSSEGNDNPFIAKFNKEGKFITTLGLPNKLLSGEGETKGIRNNFGFESLTISPDGQRLTTAVENALVQDGSQATVNSETLCRLITYNLGTASIISEKVYIAGKIISLGNNHSGRILNGLVELLSYKNDSKFLSLERSYTDETGHIPESVTLNLTTLFSG